MTDLEREPAAVGCQLARSGAVFRRARRSAFQRHGGLPRSSIGRPRTLLVVALVGLAGLDSAQVVGQCTYDLTIIQAPDCPVEGPPSTFATSLNDAGHVVGYYYQCGASPYENAFI